MTETPLARRLHESGPKRLLACDGGGIRGLITLGYLGRIEHVLRSRYGKDDLVLADYFDVIAGTSTGSIIATLLALGYPVEKILGFYRSLGGQVFQERRSWLGPLGRILHPRFQSAPIEGLLKGLTGEETLASGKLRSGLLVMAKRADTGSIWSFNNVPGHRFYEANKHLKLREVVRSSTALPGFFDPNTISDVGAGEAAVFVDGAMSMHNNPSLQLVMLATLEGFGLRWPLGADRLLLCSAGTGAYSNLPSREELARYNNLQWLGLLVSQFVNDASELVQTILQWLSKSPTAKTIDLQIGSLAGEELAGKPLLHYLRYEVTLTREALSGIGLDFSEERVRQLWELGDFKNVEDVERIGVAAAAAEVKPEHFPPVFDRRPA